MSEPSLPQALEAELSLPGLAGRLGAVLAASADPAGAPALAAQLLRAAARTDGRGLGRLWEERPGALCRVLATICGAVPFLVPMLERHPRWLGELCRDDLSRTRTSGQYEGLLAHLISTHEAPGQPAALRQFKYHELSRVSVRDLSADLVPWERVGETLAELSSLADVVLEHALLLAQEALEAELGEPVWKDERGRSVPLAFCVLGLGKLGGEELNYSSDVDLIYVHTAARQTLSGGPGELSPAEYFARLARIFGRLVSEATEDGFLYRVDLDLRPEGTQGPLVVSGDQLASYYELWAATWEKAAFMKARPVAGDLALGWRVVRSIAPMIYRSSMDLAGVAAIKEMKERIEKEAGREGGAFHVKVGAGGIRDVEFIAQALQLLHGGRIPQVRTRSTQRALIALAEVGVLPPQESQELLAAYCFLRRTENRLQMVGERQEHRLPTGAEEKKRLARSLGFLGEEPAAGFAEVLEGHRQRVRRIFEDLFYEKGSGRILSLFARKVPGLVATGQGRRMIETLAGHFAREVAESSDPQRALNNLDRFIEGVGARTFYYGLLLDRSELVARLTKLFAASDYLSAYLASHPRLIEPVFSDPALLLLTREQLGRDLEEIHAAFATDERLSPVEAQLDALRMFVNRQSLNVGLLDLDGKISMEETETALTEIAQVCVEAALGIARSQVGQVAPTAAGGPRGEGFLVVGMGKLGSRELSYGSDLDLVFFFASSGEDQALEAQEYYVRLAQRLIWALSTRTGEGTCYEIDARLRPSGGQGMLVSSLASFERYHEKSSAPWERQALLRARPIAGGTKIAARFEELRRKVLLSPLPEDLGGEIHRLRLRMESELAREGQHRHDLKTGRGGLVDVETLAQYLQLRHGPTHPELLGPLAMTGLLEILESLGLLSSERFEILSKGWGFLKLLSSRLRIVENRSISDLDEERGDLDALALRMGYAPSPRGSGSAALQTPSARRALLEDYRRHTEAIRRVYLDVLGISS